MAEPRTTLPLGAAAQADNDPHRLDYMRRDQRDPTIDTRLSPQDVMARGVVAGCAAVGGVGVLGLVKMAVCWGISAYEPSTACTVVSGAFYTTLVGIPVAGFAAAGLFFWRIFARTQIEVARASVTRDRWSNPVSVRQLARKDFGQMRWEFEQSAAFERAVAPYKQLPAGLDAYSPSSRSELGPPPADEPPPPPQHRALPAGKTVLEDLRDRGVICRSNKSLHVGDNIEDGKPQYIETKYLGALAIGGKARTGKTTRAIYLVVQAALMGWKLAICDKHDGKPTGLLSQIRPLAGAFLVDPATTAEDTVQLWRHVAQLGAQRMEELKRTPSAARYHFPVLLVIDEFTNMVLSDWFKDEDVNTLARIINEYAGVGIHTMINGHDWSAAVIGRERGAVLRRLTTHRVAHRLNAGGADFLLPRGMGKMSEGLPPGRAVFVNEDNEAVYVDCPFIGADDLAWARDNLGTWARPARIAPLDDNDLLESLLDNMGNTDNGDVKTGQKSERVTTVTTVTTAPTSRKALITAYVRQGLSQNEAYEILGGNRNAFSQEWNEIKSNLGLGRTS